MFLQGSHRVPILFINDIDKVFDRSKYRPFADDFKIFKSTKTMETVIYRKLIQDLSVKMENLNNLSFT